MAGREKDMRIFITGGAGFIGSQLAYDLIRRGDEVAIYDGFFNFIDPHESNYNFMLNWRLSRIKDKARIIRGDTRVQKRVYRCIRDFEPDIIIHLAAIAIAQKSREFPDEATTINVQGTLNILEALRDIKKFKKFIFASSSFVYGHFIKAPASEEHPTNPIDIYGGTKLAGEIFTKTYSQELGFPYVIVRPSAVYGFGDSNRRVSQILIESALSGKPLVMHDGGKTKLDFTDVRDLAQGIACCIDSEKANNQTFNITRGEGRSIKEYINIVKKYFPDVKVVEKKQDVPRPERGSLDISKAKRLIGYAPKFSLEEGLKDYIEAIKESGLHAHTIKQSLYCPR